MKLFQDLVYTGYYKATTGHHLLLKSHSGFQSIGHYLPPSLCMEASVFRKSRKSQSILKSTIKKITQEIYLRWKEALPIAFLLTHITGFPDSSVGEECACHVGDWIQSLGWEDPLEMGMATIPVFSAWRIPRRESIRLQRVGHDWATSTFTRITPKKTGQSQILRDAI